MGIILFWVYDRPGGQRRTKLLFEQTLKMVLLALKLAAIPLLRPIRKLAAGLLKVVCEDDPQ